ncbi:DUF1553 domain-containing protein [Tuwongella immobilis]|nr:DUF1553 domain-containing protein [Tuwongella immobilis]
MPRFILGVVIFLVVGGGRVEFVWAAEPIDYGREVKPLMRERCTHCHGALAQKGGLRLDTVAGMLRGGASGPAVVAGRSVESELVERVGHAEGELRMPPDGSALKPEQVAMLRRWIDAGAKGPADERPEADPKSHWAYQPIRRPELRPELAAGHANRIDAWIAAKMRAEQVTPVGVADPATLLQRVYLDLTGLPPTRAQVEAFLADPSPTAYAKVVDELLASPAYGERWARHWLDVWRYSDWYGRRSVPDVMNSYPRIYKWRDWTVRSLNADKGYDRMILEMLAADELNPTDDENIVATGFIVRNFFKWNYHSWMRDMVEHTGKAFLGLTLNCAHCHDHKYDPISQREYFQFRAFFEPLEMRHDRAPGEADPGAFRKYVYSQSYGPISGGSIRVFDEKLDAKTQFYTGGDERNIVSAKSPVPPLGLRILGGDRLTIAPVSLPPLAYYPGLKPFVRAEERQKRDAAITAKEQEGASGKIPKPLWEAQLAALRADREALEARIAADDVRYAQPPKPELVIRAASHAAAVSEKRAALAALVAQRVQWEQSPGDAKAKDALAKLLPQITAAEQAIGKAGEEYAPLSPMYPQQSTGRRLALAKWIANRDNPLTARVAVNHLWGWHFGRPLVESTADFGRNGKSPSHPELLDDLACELMEHGWSLKHLHRLIVTSATYQRQSTGTLEQVAANRQRDPDNRWLWRYPARRAEAEVVRDRLLAVAGALDRTIGGVEIPHEQGLTVPRRSLYFAHHGESRMTFLTLFDAANPCDCYRRTVSVQPQQALVLANSDLALRMSRLVARQLHSEVSTDDVAFVRLAFLQVLARPVKPTELQAALAFLARQQQVYRDANDSLPSSSVAGSNSAAATAVATNPEQPAADLRIRARESLVHVLLNHHDFVTIR